MAEEIYVPSNDDILGGIKAAIKRGQTLKEAMMTFYNAGYAKNEIEEAARNYLMEKSEGDILRSASQPHSTSQKKSKSFPKTSDQTKKKLNVHPANKPGIEHPKQKIESYSAKKEIKPLKKPTSPQVASKYEEGFKKKRLIDPISLVLILLLVFLVLILGAVFLFKEQLVSFFNSIFG